jgi:L-fuconolactonase
MIIADSQVHIWAADSPERPWPLGRAGEAQKPYPVSAESMLFQMDLAGVSRAVLVPPSWEGDYNDVVLSAAQRYPDRFGVMGRLDVRDPTALAQVARWRETPGQLGVRLTFHNEHNRFLLTEGHCEWLWPAAARASVPVMVLVPGLLPEVDRIATAHPDLRITIDHIGLNIRKRAPEVFDILPEVCALARHPNIAVKASGLAALSTKPYPFDDVHDAIRALVDAFGPRRVFWGTDLTRMNCTYYECITLFTEHQTWLSDDEMEWVMGRGLTTWLDWPLS